jgi:hypothetical protein
MDQVTYQIVDHGTPTGASVQLTISSSSPSTFHQTHLTVKTNSSAVGVSGNITKGLNSGVITVDTSDYNALLSALTNFPCPPGPMPLTLSGNDNADGTILIVNSWTLPGGLSASTSEMRMFPRVGGGLGSTLAALTLAGLAVIRLRRPRPRVP